MIFTAPPRYLLKLAYVLKQNQLEEIKMIGEKIEELAKEKFGFEMTEEKLPSEWKFWDDDDDDKELTKGIFLHRQGNHNSISLNMSLRGSLAMYAQLVRQRQILCEIEPLERIAKKARFTIPPSFSINLKENYKEIAKLAVLRQQELIEKKIHDLLTLFC